MGNVVEFDKDDSIGSRERRVRLPLEAELQLRTVDERAQAGDTLVIWKLDRLGRSIQGLIALAADLSVWIGVEKGPR